MAPIRKGDGTEIAPKGIAEVRKGDGTVIYSDEPAIPDSAISRWTLDNEDTESGVAIDTWGNNDGSINGATTGVGGANQTYTTNEAYGFDGTDDYVDAGSGVLPNVFSFAAWFRKTSTGDEGIIGSTYDEFTDGIHGWECKIEEDGDLTARYGDGSDTISQTNHENPLDDSAWYHVVSAIDADNGNIQAFVDGSNVIDASGLSTMTIDHGPLNIGRAPFPSSYFTGQVDDPRTFNKLLSASEVSSLYNTGRVSG